MTEKATGTGTIDQAQEIQNQLSQALIELDQIRNSQQVISDPNAMEAVERTIIQANDEIAALISGQITAAWSL